MKASRSWDITALLNAAAHPATRVERNTWLVRLGQWLRAKPSEPTPGQEGSHPELTRLKHLLNVLEQHTEPRAQVQALFAHFWHDVDAMTLLADYGLGPRVSLRSEIGQRLSEKLLPATLDTNDLAQLFGQFFQPSDDGWMQAIDDPTLQRLAHLISPFQTSGAPAVTPEAVNQVLHNAMTALAAAMSADGMAARLRRRMDGELVAGEPFAQLVPTVERLRRHQQQGQASEALREATYLRALIDACRRATDSVRQHLDEFGVSVDIVFAVEQLHERAARLEALMDVAVAPEPATAWRNLVVRLLRDVLQRRALKALVQRQTHQLARSVADRNAEVGEHYITRDRPQWRAMLQRALGGGVAVAGTTVLKYAIASLALLPFWEGVANGTNYALSFVVIMLLHWTLATKQPAMTAPALAVKANDVADEAGLQAFVDTVAQLIRSQAAGVLGNLAAVLPAVLLIQWGFAVVTGAPLISAAATAKTLPSLSLLGPTLLFAAFTGVLLFASSVFAGWVENWFVFRQLDGAIASNPRVVGLLGARRAARWAHWWRQHVSGVAGNVSLGFMLGLVPVLLAFVGIGLEARHVTLSMGQIAAAVGARGLDVWSDPALWWALAAVPLIGTLNLAVSFWLAYTLALRARGVRVRERDRLHAAIRQRLKTSPLSFIVPPRHAPAPSDQPERSA